MEEATASTAKRARRRAVVVAKRCPQNHFYSTVLRNEVRKPFSNFAARNMMVTTPLWCDARIRYILDSGYRRRSFPHDP